MTASLEINFVSESDTNSEGTILNFEKCKATISRGIVTFVGTLSNLLIKTPLLMVIYRSELILV